MFVLYDKKRKGTIRLKKRLLSLLLAAVMLLSALPLGLVDTAEAAAASSGQCGDDIRWTLDASGTLTISGTGAMYNYDYIGGSNPAPWCVDGLRSRVRTVVVKKGITELGYDVFAECSELQKVTLPSGLTRIGSCAFIDCYSLPELTIPATVTTIESNAFTNCNSIKTLTLPGGLKEIGDAACSQMESLSSVTLGKGITRLSPYMFNMCYALTSVTVPEGVTDIGSCAFRYCESLQTMHLPAILKTVGEGASSGTNIADVYFAGTAAQWNALRMEPGNNHIRCAKVHYRNAAAVPAAPKIKLMNSGNQFQLSWDAVPGAASYQVYRIVDSTVEDYTLLGTTKSTTFTGKTAKTGTTYTFAVKAANANGESMMSSSCAGKLSAAPANVTLGAAKVVNGGIQVTWQKAAGAVTYTVYRMGPGDTYWKVVSAKQSGTSYTDKNITAGSTYKYTVRGVASDGTTLSPGFNNTGVSAMAFTEIAHGKCGENLTWTLTSNNTLTISGKGAMYDYGQFNSSGGVTPPWIAAGYQNEVKYVRIETGITYVGQNAFADCSSITSVSFPYTLEEIGDCAFQNCTRIYSLSLPYKTVSTGNGSTITAPSVIGNAAFRGCVRLGSVYLPVTIKAIGTSAFADCFALNDVGYTGSESDWEAISIGDGNILLSTANIRYNVSYGGPKTG